MYFHWSDKDNSRNIIYIHTSGKITHRSCELQHQYPHPPITHHSITTHPHPRISLSNPFHHHHCPPKQQNLPSRTSPQPLPPYPTLPQTPNSQHPTPTYPPPPKPQTSTSPPSTPFHQAQHKPWKDVPLDMPSAHSSKPHITFTIIKSQGLMEICQSMPAPEAEWLSKMKKVGVRLGRWVEGCERGVVFALKGRGKEER